MALPTSTHTRPRRLAGRARTPPLVLHVLAAGTWLVLDLALVSMVFFPIQYDDPGPDSYPFETFRVVAVWPMLAAAVLTVLTGLVLGLGRKEGLVRNWWVLTKLGLSLLILALFLLQLPLDVDGATRLGSLYVAVSDAVWLDGMWFLLLISSPALLLVVFLLSTFKPWGRVRQRSQPGA